MDKLYSWTVKRSGASMTIEHSCGKIAGVVSIVPRMSSPTADRQTIVALTSGAREFELATMVR